MGMDTTRGLKDCNWKANTIKSPCEFAWFTAFCNYHFIYINLINERNWFFFSLCHSIFTKYINNFWGISALCIWKALANVFFPSRALKRTTTEKKQWKKCADFSWNSKVQPQRQKICNAIILFRMINAMRNAKKNSRVATAKVVEVKVAR